MRSLHIPAIHNPAGAVAFELLARRQLLPVGQSLADYESRVHSLPLMDMSGALGVARCTKRTRLR